MKKKDNRRKCNNSGLTLIELVVTIAIIAIFSGVILSLITSGSGFYRSTSNNAKVQMDTQELLDDIEDLIIDTNRSVYYSYGFRKDAKEDSNYIGGDIDRPDSRDKTFFVCNQYDTQDGVKKYYDILEWVASKQTIYYSRVSGTGSAINRKQEEQIETVQIENDDSDFTSGEDSEEVAALNAQNAAIVNSSVQEETIAPSVFATGILHFNADVEKAASDRVVRFQLTTDSGGKKIKTIHTVNLRNRITIEKPDDQAAEGESDNLAIFIDGAKPTIEAGGDPMPLTYYFVPDLIPGVLDVDVSTIRWHVDGQGYFPEGKNTSGELRAYPDGTGELIVTVSAVTIKGKYIESAPVTISIINNKKPSNLVPSADSVLIGAGNSVSLNTLVSWNQKYDDGSETEVEEVQWSTDCTFASVGPDGNVTIDAGAGTEQTGSFTVTATNPETGSKGTVTVNVARIDLVKPEHEKVYHVGDEKPLEYVYREAGQVVGKDAEILTVTQPSTSSAYKEGEKFTENDIGQWKIKAHVQIPDTGTYVEAENDFMVEAAAVNADIHCNKEKRTNTIMAGATYSCSYYNRYHFYIDVPLLENDNWKYTLVWSIDGQSDKGTYLKGTTVQSSDSSNAVDLVVGKNEQGFILSADMTVYDKNTNIVYGIYKGSLNVEIVNKITIINPPGEVVIGRTYPVKAEVMSSYKDGNEYKSRILENTDSLIEWTASTQDFNVNAQWKIPENQKDISISASFKDYESTDVMMGKEERMILSDTKDIKVIQPPIALTVKDSDDRKEKTIYPDESIGLNATLSIDGIEQSKGDDVSWKCEKDGNSLGDVLSQSQGLENKFELPDYGQKEGTYIISATYTRTGMEPIVATYTVTVVDYTVTKEIVVVDDKTSVLPSEEAKVWFKVENEKGPVQIQGVNWSITNNGKINPNWHNGAGMENLVTFSAANPGTYTIKATGNDKNGKSYSAEQEIIVTTLTMVITPTNGDFYQGMASQSFTAQIFNADNDEIVTDHYNIEWSVVPDNDAVYSISSSSSVPALAQFSVNGNVQKMQEVQVRATAKDNNGAVVISHAVKINVNSKTTITKSYNCNVGVEQELEFNTEDSVDSIKNDDIEVYVLKTNATTPTRHENINNIPTMSLINSEQKLKVKMNQTGEDFDNYRYILISVDLVTVQYNFYVYPVKNNVYNGEYGDRNLEAFTYVPYTTTEISKTSKLNLDKYTYDFTDSTKTKCELRLSIHKKTGIGSFAGNYIDSSVQKWFMRRGDTFYRYDSGGWYEFNNGEAHWSNLIKRAKLVRYYWDLEDTIILIGEDNKSSNKKFWYKWN